MLAGALAGCGAGGAPERQSPSSLAEGRSLFTGEGCGGCHALRAADARGEGGPDFDSSEKLDRAQIVRQLNTGTGGMPSYRARLSDHQEAALAAFLFHATHSH